MASPFSSLVAAADAACLNAFGVPAVLHPQSGGPDIPFTGITLNPVSQEDYVPGSLRGVTVVHLFMRFVDLAVPPQKGDRVTFGGVTYDLFEDRVDREGGAVLKLRRNA